MRTAHGFTLAEVLITLSIIGVIAALTIPAVTKKFEKATYIAGYKETYSILSQATKMITANNGGSLEGLWTTAEGAFLAYEPYLKINKRCYNVTPLGNCFASSYKELNCTTETEPYSSYYSLILTNGVVISIGSEYLYIDINGSKGPNVMGKDFHRFNIITSTGEIKPYNWGVAESTIISRCPSNLQTSEEYTGFTCGVRIMRGDYATDY